MGTSPPLKDQKVNVMTKQLTIGERLRAARGQCNLTAKALSDMSGVPEKTIYRIEKGEVKDPKVSSIVPIATALECTTDELIVPETPAQGDLGSLKRAFAVAATLPEHDRAAISEIVEKFNLAASIEKHRNPELYGEQI